MSELRWNPLLKEWVITATHRQERTFKPPRGYCPLCPGHNAAVATEVPLSDYDIVVFENKFPSLKPFPPPPQVRASHLYPVEEAVGYCEVLLFTSDHEGLMSQQPRETLYKVLQVWKHRYHELGQQKEIEYVFIFENKGEEVGVTLHHPHGQIYAYPFIPPIINRELESSREYYEQQGQCLFCAVLQKEEEDGRRIVAENHSFIAFIPFFARYPYEVHIYPRKHSPSCLDLTPEQEKDLADLWKTILMKYDGLFQKPLPYVMAIHQQPTNGQGAHYSHFHMEFYPPHRTADKLKYLAGSEIGAGTYINDSLAEEKARELRGVCVEGGNTL